MDGLLLALAGLLLLAAAAAFSRRGRRRGTEAALPEDWERILERRFALYRRLPEALRPRLEARMREFLAEKRFESCGGLGPVTPEMRTLIAAQACFLLVGRPQERTYPRLRSILLYPGAFRDRGRRLFGLDDADDTGREIRLGESWHGAVVLAWDSVQRGAEGADDGVNVVFHEFAHQLDQSDGATDGLPPLDREGDHAAWAEVMRRDYEALRRDANDPRADPLLDPYGAEDPAEFFAVATETFFEMPLDLQAEHRELYERLREYYGTDPAAWESEA